MPNSSNNHSKRSRTRKPNKIENKKITKKSPKGKKGNSKKKMNPKYKNFINNILTFMCNWSRNSSCNVFWIVWR